MNREFIDELKDQLTKLVDHGVIMERNTPALQTWFRSATNTFLSDMSSQEVIRDYIVVCDESNNPLDVIGRNEFKADIYFRTVASENFRRVEVVVGPQMRTFYYV